MTYQSFPGEKKGHSDSVAKLNALGFPASLDGLSFLDIGCNEGFFCFEARRRGAAISVGVDTFPAFIEAARERSKRYGIDVDVRVGDVFDVEGKFDFILVASVLHYISSPIQFFRKVHSLLKPSGTLLLELGVIDTERDLTRVFRDDKDYVYPSRNFLVKNWLRDFDSRLYGESVSQPGDPVDRKVFHCQKVHSVYLTPASASSLSMLSTVEGQRIDADQFFLPAVPRSLARVPDYQKKIFDASAAVDSDPVLTWKSVSSDPSVVDSVVRMLADVIRFQGGARHTFVEGQIIPLIADKLAAQLKPAEGFRVFSLVGNEASGSLRVGQSGPIDIQSTQETRADIERVGIQTWVERFLLENRSPNRALYERVTKRPAYWIGPVDVAVSNLVPMAGPGRKYHEDQSTWDMRADQIAKAITSPNDVPPAIVFVRRESDGSESLVIADGAHRHEAFKRKGFKTMPVLIWFDSKADYELYQERSSG